MKKKSVGKTTLLTRLTVALARFKSKAFTSSKATKANAIAAEYEAWRQRFLGERLHLGLWLALICVFTFSLLNLYDAVFQLKEFENLPKDLKALSFVIYAAILLSLLTCLAIQKTQIGRRHPGLIFLGLSWSVTLVGQIGATIKGFALPDVFIWSLVFLTQATLMPVRWPLHLVSQLGVLVYYFGVNTALGLKLPGSSEPIYSITLFLYLFWFCFICNLAVYLYESLQRAEFKARHELETAYQKLGVAEAKYRSIFENAVEGIFQTTPDGRYITTNPALARIYGYETPEEVTAHFTDIEHQLYVNPNRRAEFVRLIQQHGTVSEFESQIYRKDGSIVWISENARAVFDQGGNLLYFEGLIEDITDRKRAEEALRVFFYAVSHDLRNPVMGTLMVLKNLLDQPGEKLLIAREILERMIQSCDRQLSLINSLLETHASEVRGVVLHQEPVQLSELIQEIVEDFKLLLAQNQGTLRNLVAAELPLVNADPTQLRRVFENLLTNALKHNPPGLNLTLAATVKDQMICCTIQDNGVGMSQDECDRLFELYFQGSGARHSLGIGLGLYLCRQIITAHGGEIGVKSSPGKGATFWFTLPLFLSEPSLDSVKPYRRSQLPNFDGLIPTGTNESFSISVEGNRSNIA